MFRYQVLTALLLAAIGGATPALGQPGAAPGDRLTLQHEAMARLAFMDRRWEGTAPQQFIEMNLTRTGDATWQAE